MSINKDASAINERGGKRVKWFWLIYTVLTLALVCAVGWLLHLLNAWLVEYERNVPESVLSDMAQQLEAGDTDGIFEELEHTLQPWETDESCSAGLAAATKGRGITWEKYPQGDDGTSKAYTVLADGDAVCRVTLEQISEPNRLGLVQYAAGSISPVKTAQVWANELITVSLDGYALDDAWVEEAGLEYDGAEYIPAEFCTPMTWVKYKAFFYYDMPVITGAGPEGMPVESGVDKESGAYTYHLAVGEQTAAEIEPLALAVSERYSLYITNDLGWGPLSVYFLREAPIYDQLRTMEVNWYGHHERVYFEDMKVYEYKACSEECVAASVSYITCVVRDGRVIEYPTDVTYYFLNQGGGWIICGLKVN